MTDHLPSKDVIKPGERRFITEPGRIVIFDPEDGLWLVKYDDHRSEWVARDQIGSIVDATPDPAARSETAWLVEMSFDGKAHWWYGSDFTDDAGQAVRFSRKQDADQVILERGLVDATATEHMWCSGPPPGDGHAG